VLQAMDIEGSHSLESLAIGGLQLSNINAQLSVRNGRLSLNLRPAGFYAGQLTAAMNFDTRQTPPSLTSIVSVQNLDIAQLARSVPAAAFAQGKLNLESFHTLQGRTTGELLASINGSTSFSVTDNAIDIGIVKQLFSSISVLSPAGSGDLAQRWPDVVRFASAKAA
jgi:AsmA protein